MSYDFALAKVCSHRMVDEPVALEAKSYFRFTRYVGDTKDIVVTVDGIEVPPEGLITKPAIYGFRSGPFHIVRGYNDLLRLRNISSNVSFDLKIPVGNNISAENIVTSILRQIGNHDIAPFSQNGKLYFEATYPSLGPFFECVDPRADDKDQIQPLTPILLRTCTTLGIQPGRVAVGRKVFPGWRTVTVNNSNYNSPGVEFHYPLPNANPVVRVSYTGISTTCGRCQGSLIEYDYSIVGGTYETVTDTDLLSQEFDKFLFTKKGSHFKWGWYGSDILNSVATKSLPSSNPLLTLSINQAFDTYRNIKSQQASQFRIQGVTDLEMPRSLARLKVSLDSQDPTVMIADVSVESVGMTTTSYTRTLTTPRDPFNRIGNLQISALGSSNGYILR